MMTRATALLTLGFVVGVATASWASDCPCDAATNHTALIDFYYYTQGPNWSPVVPSNVTGWGTFAPVCEWTGLSCQGELLAMDLHLFHLNGTVPHSLWADIGNLGNVTFSANYMLPAFAGATRLASITMWDATNVCLPDSWATLPSLTSIQAVASGFWGCGKLPASWGAMKRLENLIMPGCALAGALPPSWSGMTSLQVLDLSQNMLNGTIPESWASMRRLRRFRLSYNSFTGFLPAWLGNCTNLTEISLEGYGFTGALPAAWADATSLTFIDVSTNALTGPLPATWSRLVNLTTLYLASNQLSGTLPTSWVGMTSLSDLQLQYNHLTGPIPPLWYSLIHRNFDCTGIDPCLKTVLFNNNWLTGTPDLCLFAQLNVSLTAVANNNFTGMPDISCFPNGCNSQRVQAAFTGNQFCGECFLNSCNCTVQRDKTIAEERSLSIIETSSTVTCCTSCQTTPGCVAAVFFSIAGLHYCDLKNVSSPLVAKTGYTTLLWRH